MKAQILGIFTFKSHLRGRFKPLQVSVVIHQSYCQNYAALNIKSLHPFHFADKRQVLSWNIVFLWFHWCTKHDMVHTHANTHTVGNGLIFHNSLHWSEFIFCHKWDPQLNSLFSPPTLLRKSLPQIARCLPGGACLTLWLMTVLLWLRLLNCSPTFLLVALFEKFVGTCSDSSSAVYLRAFITITRSDAQGQDIKRQWKQRLNGHMKFP